MKIDFDVKIHSNGNSILLNDRWQVYADGIIYDTKHGKDIPQWIFEFRDFVLKNYKNMKYQID